MTRTRHAAARIQRLLLPAPPAPETAPGSRRTGRDRAVGASVFAGALMVGLAVYGPAHLQEHPPAWAEAADLPLGMLACCSLWWRRTHPLGVALLAVPSMLLSASAFGAGTVITLNLALRAPGAQAAAVLGVFVTASQTNVWLVVPGDERGWQMAFVLAYHLVFFAWGRALRARRLLLARLRQDVARERAGHARRLAEVRRGERQAIAREMHDVLAHRISLLSVHAGALDFRSRQSATAGGTALTAHEVATSTRIIRDNAHQALEELQEVLQLLRTTDTTPTAPGTMPTGPGTTPAAPDTAPPQPHLDDIPALVTEARTAGQTVELHREPDDRAGQDLNPRVQRTAYRVVQEGLTNARKHAPGATVSVRLAGSPGRGLTLEVTNALPAGRFPAQIPGAQVGLTGLGERVALDGGTLTHHRTGGRFVLRAQLPWPPHDTEGTA
ncbi:sensor histidine kinase [Streptomyces sp. NPDC050161]|uniref:sensor histidine kinase n=1 Tax=Streptomyces sp. NPDC050161 TaxID=3365604 RepID=UPI00379E5302